MAVQDYIGWATGVNRTILDSSNITVGENAIRTDELESGLKRSVKKNAFCPDKFSVKMVFNWTDEVILKTYDNNGNVISETPTGKTEYQLFTEWYKYYHKFGTVPFEFPTILYSQDTGIFVNDWVYSEDRDRRWQVPSNVSYYKITSSVPANKSGECVEVDMTWEVVYSGVISISPDLPEVRDCEASEDYLDIHFVALGTTAPTSQMFTVYIDDEEKEITGFYYDGFSTVRLYYEHTLTGDVTFSMNYPDYIVAKDDFESQI